MKNYSMIFGVFVLMAAIGFSFIACPAEDDPDNNGDTSGGNTPPFDGDWYSAEHSVTYTFDTSTKKFIKMQDEGWGERGTFRWNASTFVCTITEATDEGITWKLPPPGNQLVWNRSYSFSGGNMIIDGSVFVKKGTITEPVGATPFMILSIGNSFSEDAMRYIRDILIKNGKATEDICLVNAYIGGMDLQGHASNAASDAKAYTRQSFGIKGSMSSSPGVTLKSLIKEKKWDYITLQQASHHSGNAGTYDPYIDNLLKFIKDNCTNPDVQIGWHMTWAYAKDSTHSGFPYYGSNQMTMYDGIVNAVKTKIVPKGFDFIIPVGTAIQNARTTELFGDKLNSDGYHLNDFGRFIAGAMWVRQIYELDVDVFESYQAMNKFDLTQIHITTIKQCVDDAFEEPFEITDQD